MVSQNSLVKNVINEENKENLINEKDKSKSIIIIDDKKAMDISMRHFSKPYAQHSSSAGLKKKTPSLQVFEKPTEELESYFLNIN